MPIEPDNLVRVIDLCKFFPTRRNWLGTPIAWKKAVDHVSFTIPRGQTYALVGESGCGKTTTGRCLLRLIDPTGGAVFIDEMDIAQLSASQLIAARRRMQMIFQDPYSSLNSRFNAGAIVSEGWDIHHLYPRSERAARLEALFQSVGLLPEQINRYPHEFSGGQRQRLSIARALALAPEFIVGDEVVSALDVSIQAQIINLLMELQATRGITYLFISHNLAVVRHIAHRVGVMYAGQLVEEAATDELFAHPLHPYTQILLSAIPVIDPAQRRPRLQAISEEPPAPRGCPFAPRCARADDECRRTDIPETNHGGHRVKCRKVNKP